ncbi:hypothetical protein GCM10008090_08250 [Arenicella chitinivorans]|uniref:DUF4381 domain-containing protein n=1 Tax=Arenicella chitinivorans TaxID=1329800 RepID=A0A918VIG7_9GAMM|nr:DUF4381 domain-containing protein [Arenicella chitinivorans]GHA01459.1 hypothetical protein GCM10008090_08250 [Arenicella chitinivorans]
MTDTAPQLLEQLRDVHMPEPVSWWPLAPGYWLLLGLIVAMLLALVFWWQRRPQGRDPRMKQLAINELDRIYARWQQHQDTTQYLRAVNSTLKRFLLGQALSSVAKLTGESWLAALDQISPLDSWSESTRHALAFGLYQSPSDRVDVDPLHQEVVNWFAKLSVDSNRHELREARDA